MVELEPVTSGKCTTHPQEHTNKINEGPDAMVTAELVNRQITTAYFLPLFPPKKHYPRFFLTKQEASRGKEDTDWAKKKALSLAYPD